MPLKHLCRSIPLHAGGGSFVVPLFAWLALLQLIVGASSADHFPSIGDRNSANETPSETVDIAKDSPHISIQGKIEEHSPVSSKDIVQLLPQTANEKASPLTEQGRTDGVEDSILKQKTSQSLKSRKPNKSSLIQTMRDQIELAKMFLSFVRINSSPRLLRDLKSQIRENEQVLKNARKDAHLPKSASDKVKALDRVLAKAQDQWNKCEVLGKRLRSLLLANEEKIQVLKEESNFLGRLAARTMPKGLHCLALQLTIKYYNQQNKSSVLVDGLRLEDPQLYHYAIFSDNILAAAVVVNSTVYHVKEPNKHVFHVLTDSLNYAAMKMWFVANSPGSTIVDVKNLDDFHFPLFSRLRRRYLWLSLSKLSPVSLNVHRKSSENFGQVDQTHLYLPDMFPNLDKILLLEDDIVVRKDLTGLWRENLNGKFSGAVKSCLTSNYYADSLPNLSPEGTLNRIDLNRRVWQSCIHIFDLKEMKRRKVTEIYKDQTLLSKSELVSGAVPPGLVAALDNTYVLQDVWNVVNLDGISDAKQDQFQGAAAIHYGGYIKPWLEMNGKSYKAFWTKFVNYENPVLEECNISK